MGQTELLLTIGAITIFGVLMLSVNTHMVEQAEAIYQQQGEFYALSLAQQYIEEAKLRAYDQQTVAGTVSSPSGFTNTPLGPGGPTDRNDVDDYVTSPIIVPTTIGDMLVSITVVYVPDTDLRITSLSKTYYKKMRVTVQSDYLDNPVYVEHVFAFQKNLN